MRPASNTRLRTALCALTFTVLGACGGGGGGGDTPPAKPTSTTTIPPNEVATLPQEGSMRVDGGNSSLAAGSYGLDFSGDKAVVSGPSDGDTLVYLTPASSAFDSLVVYAQDNADKFAIFILDNRTADRVLFACHTAAWTKAQLQDLLGEAPVAVAPCPSGIALDVVKRHLALSNVKLPALQDENKSLTLSANFGWRAPDAPGVVTSPETPATPPGEPPVISPPMPSSPGLLVIEPGSSVASPGSYAAEMPQQVSETSLGGIQVKLATFNTNGPALTLYTQIRQPAKYVVHVTVQTGPGSWGDYVCASHNWSSEDLATMAVDFSHLQPCPGTVSFDTGTRRLKLDKAVLPEWRGASQQAVVSFNAVMSDGN